MDQEGATEYERRTPVSTVGANRHLYTVSSPTTKRSKSNMSETIQMRSGKDEEKTSGDYTVFDAATVGGEQPAKGFAFLTSAASQVGRFIEVSVSEGDDLVLEKTTSATGRYSTEGPAVRHIYLSHALLSEFGGEATDEGFDAPESLGISISPSDADSFEESKQMPEDAEAEAEGLLSGVGDSDAVEVSEDEEEDDADAEAEALLAEAEDAA